MADMLMNAKDAISGALGDCYVTIHKPEADERYFLMQTTKVEAKIDKTKTEVAIMGKTGKGNKSTGWKGTGTMTLYYNTSLFRELLERYKNTGEDIYFDMVIHNNDKGSDAGEQTTILYGCNLDGGTIAKLDSNSETLDEDVSFTFEDFEFDKTFTVLPNMKA